MNSLPRWLISVTDMPVPCQSSISSAARRRTGSGRTAGPGLKLKGRVMARLSSRAFAMPIAHEFASDLARSAKDDAPRRARRQDGELAETLLLEQRRRRSRTGLGSRLDRRRVGRCLGGL